MDELLKRIEPTLSLLRRNKKKLLISIPLLPVAYMLDVWIMGTISAGLYDIAVNFKNIINEIYKDAAPQKVSNVAFYFFNPFSVSMQWLTKSSSELTAPGIRNIWLTINVFILSTAAILRLKKNWIQLRNKKNDSKYIHGLKVADNPAEGNTRWAGMEDIAHISEFGPPYKGSGGIVMGKIDEILRIIPGKNSKKGEIGITGHVAAYGVTGSGKSKTFVANNIIAAVEDEESIVTIDPKGELFKIFSKWLIKKGYKLYVFNLVNPNHSNQWNPIMECRNDEEIAEMATCMIENAANDKNDYFVAKEIQLYEALAGLLKYSFSNEQAHPRSVLSLASWTQDKLEQVITSAYREGKISATVYERWRGASKSNLDNAQSGLTAKLKIITTDALAALMSGHEIDLESIGQRKTALFINLPIRGTKTLKPILSTFNHFLLKRLYDLAELNGGRLPVDVRCIYDEFGNIGRIPSFSETINTARSIGIKIQYILQGRSQLNDVYGEDEANNILASTPIALLLGVAPTDEVTIDLFSEQLGDASVYMEKTKKDVTTIINKMELTEKTKVVGRRKLMENYELKEISTRKCIAMVQGCKPLFMEKVWWTQLPQSKEIKELGDMKIQEYFPQRQFNVELPKGETFEQSSVMWGMKTGEVSPFKNETIIGVAPWVSPNANGGEIEEEESGLSWDWEEDEAPEVNDPKVIKETKSIW